MSVLRVVSNYQKGGLFIHIKNVVSIRCDYIFIYQERVVRFSFFSKGYFGNEAGLVPMKSILTRI